MTIRPVLRTLATVTILAFAGACAQPVPATTAKTLRIAAVGPVTGSQAEVGQDLLNGIRLAVDERNAAGGVLGQQVEFVQFDDAADPKQAVAVAQKIASDPTIVGVVGHMNSGTTKAASPVYHEAGIPIVMPVPTNPEITTQGFNNLFRVPPTDLDQGTDLAKFALERLKKTKFAIIHDSTDYGQPLAMVFRQTVEKTGGKVVAFDGISEGDKDFRALLTRVKSQSPEVLFFAGIYNEGGLIAKQAHDLGLKVVFLSADGCFGQRFIEIGSGAATEGAILSFIAPDESTNTATKAFGDKFRQKYGVIKVFAPLGYDAANVLMTGIQKAGKADHEAIIAALHAPDFSYSGVTGQSSFDQTGNNNGRRVYFFVVKGGKFVPYDKQ